MSPWTHIICQRCYEQREPGRESVRLEPWDTVWVACCFCGEPTNEGTYYRYDPASLRCNGVHAEET